MAFFSGLASEGYDRQYSDRQLVTRIAGYFSPYWLRLVIVTLLVLDYCRRRGSHAGYCFGDCRPACSSKLISLPLSYSCVVIVFVAGLITWIANWGRRRLVTRIVGNIVLTLRTDAFRAAAEHDLSFYDVYASGKVVSRITSDTQEFGQMVVLVTDLFAQILQALILGAILFMIEWKLALLLFAFLPLVFLLAAIFRKLARQVTRAGMRAMANVNATIKETFNGIAVAKNFRQEASIFAEFDQANQQSYNVNWRRGFVLSLVFPVLNAFGGVATAILVYVGGISCCPGHRHRRRLVSLPAKPGPFLLPSVQPFSFLGSGSARSFSGRARVCANRRRVPGCPGRRTSCPTSARRYPVCRGMLRIFRARACAE